MKVSWDEGDVVMVQSNLVLIVLGTVLPVSIGFYEHPGQKNDCY